MTTKKLYAKRDTAALGEHYTSHIQAMTAEGLDSKSDIAAELAHRDSLIAKWREKDAEQLPRQMFDRLRTGAIEALQRISTVLHDHEQDGKELGDNERYFETLKAVRALSNALAETVLP